jgi:catechol 2,3-dioxygenase-like lactoylglutathione lyase family enzyme
MDMNQVTIEVRDFSEGIEFYTKVGLRLIVSERGEYARFELPSGSSTFSFHVSNQPIESNTMLYFEVDDVDHRYEELLGSGIIFDSPPTDQSWKWREARFSDPTGNKLCLFHAGLDRRFPPWRI